MTKITCLNAAQWHADKACAAYLSGEIDLYIRHIVISKRLRRLARNL